MQLQRVWMISLCIASIALPNTTHPSDSGNTSSGWPGWFATLFTGSVIGGAACGYAGYMKGEAQGHNRTIEKLHHAHTTPYHTCLKTVPIEGAITKDVAENLYQCITLHKSSLDDLIQEGNRYKTHLGGALQSAGERAERSPSKHLDQAISDGTYTHANVNKRLINLSQNKPIFDAFIYLRNTSTTDAHKQYMYTIIDNHKSEPETAHSSLRGYAWNIYKDATPVTPLAHAYQDIKEDINTLTSLEHNLHKIHIPDAFQDVRTQIQQQRERLMCVASRLEQDQQCQAQLQYEKEKFTILDDVKAIRQKQDAMQQELQDTKKHTSDIQEQIKHIDTNKLQAIKDYVDGQQLNTMPNINQSTNDNGNTGHDT